MTPPSTPQPPTLSEKEPPKPVGIWIRVSTMDQAQGESPEHHEQRAQYYAKAKEWRVVEVYNLSGVSGKSIIDHPETKRMLLDVKSGRITGLIFSKLARLARNTRELLDLADVFRQCNADLVSLSEAIDTSTPSGRLFFTMIAAMAQWEREEISERVSASVPVRAKLGKPLGGAAPFGYIWKDKQLVIDGKEAPIRKLLHELFAKHKRKKTVANILNEKGHRTRRGAKFTDTTIRRMLEDPVVKGMHRTNYTKNNGEGVTLKPEEEWIYTQVEPLISEELWDECRTILGAQMRKYAPRAKPRTYLFSGIAHCHCGAKMYPRGETKKYICEACRNKIPADDLETVFHEQLRTFLVDDQEVSKLLSQTSVMLSDLENQVTLLTKEADSLQSQMTALIKIYTRGEISGESFRATFSPMEQRKEQISMELPSLAAQIDLLKINTLSSDQIIDDARDLHAKWPTLSHNEQRRIIDSITQRIEIGTDTISIDLCHLPSLDTATKRQQNHRGWQNHVAFSTSA